MQPVSLDMQPYDAKDPGAPLYAPHHAYARGAGPPARDYVLWSLFNTIFLNACCLGFVALVYSFKSRDCQVVGDVEGATSYGKRARDLNIAALIVNILFGIIVVSILIVYTAVVVQQLLERQKNPLNISFNSQGK